MTPDDRSPAPASLRERLLQARHDLEECRVWSLDDPELYAHIEGLLLEAADEIANLKTREKEANERGFHELYKPWTLRAMQAEDEAKTLTATLDAKDIEIGMLRQEIACREESRLKAIRELETQDWVEPKD